MRAQRLCIALLVTLAVSATVAVDINIARDSTSSITYSPYRDWNYEDNLYFLMFAYGAYCPANEVADWTCKYCAVNGTAGFNTTATFYNETDNTFGYAGYDDTTQRVVLSFRGTIPTSIINDILDIESLGKEDCPFFTGCKDAIGFTKAYNSLRDQLLPVVTDLLTKFPTYEFWVTGHSLGASMATVAAADLAYTLGVTPNVNSFGEVRVGDDQWAEWWDQTMNVSWRNTNKKDIVPHLIPRALNYHHVATEVWRNLEDKYVVCDGTGEDPDCSDSNIVDLSIYDHLHYMGIHLDCGEAFDSNVSAEDMAKMRELAGRGRRTD